MIILQNGMPVTASLGLQPSVGPSCSIFCGRTYGSRSVACSEGHSSDGESPAIEEGPCVKRGDTVLLNTNAGILGNMAVRPYVG